MNTLYIISSKSSMKPKDILLEKIEKFNIHIEDLDAVIDEGISVILGFYSFEIIKICESNNSEELSRHILFLSELADLNLDEINNSLEIDVLNDIYHEFGEENIFEQMIDGKLKDLYCSVISSHQ